jgi:hypothetical protein
MNASTSLPTRSNIAGRARPTPDDAPWWRHAMVWVVIAGPLAVLVAGFVTLGIAWLHVDPVITDNTGASARGRVPIGPAAPALQARNHAATPQK